MRRDRVIRPGKRKPRATTRPSAASVEFPLADYIVPPSDAKGRSQSVSIGLPPSVTRLAAMVVEGETLPFETKQDAYRWAIFHGMQALVKMSHDPNITAEWVQLMNWRRTNSQLMESLVYKEILERTFKTIDKLMEDGHFEKALVHAEMTWMNADKLQDPYWADVYRKQARAKLDRVKKAVTMAKRKAADRNGGNRDDE